jgi:hypothetical protein
LGVASSTSGGGAAAPASRAGAPWKPATCAAAITEPNTGSSPAPSTTRPQRGSRATSTIGANVQCTPCAAASAAATRAAPATAAESNVAAWASGTGKTVRQPWMTSNEKRSGILSRDCSTATRCRRRVSATP